MNFTNNLADPELFASGVMNGKNWNAAQQERLLKQLEETLKPSRFRHTIAVAKEAVKLAECHGEDQGKAQLAALFHDMAKGFSVDDMNRMAAEAGLPKQYQNRPNLAHSKLAVVMMQRDYGITDQELLDAVAYHTTGRAGMTKLDQILFLADAIEPARKYPGVERIRTLSYEDLDKACIRSLERTVEYIREKGEYLDPDTEAAKDDLKEKLKL